MELNRISAGKRTCHRATRFHHRHHGTVETIGYSVWRGVSHLGQGEHHIELIVVFIGNHLHAHYRSLHLIKTTAIIEKCLGIIIECLIVQATTAVVFAITIITCSVWIVVASQRICATCYFIDTNRFNVVSIITVGGKGVISTQRTIANFNVRIGAI